MDRHKPFVTFVSRLAKEMPTMVPVTVGQQATIVADTDRFAAYVRLVSLDYRRIYVSRYRASRQDDGTWDMKLPHDEVECYSLRPNGRYVRCDTDDDGPALEVWQQPPAEPSV